jgi:signal transduction histidine kinase
MVDARFMRKDGSCFDGHLKIKVLDPSDPMKKYVATISDISWRKQAEQERIYREKLEGVLEMAGAACHELNQPLMAILAKSEMLMSDLGEGTPPYEQARFIKDQAARMGELTRKIRNIRKYKTMAYVRDSRIIDIHKASEDE